MADTTSPLLGLLLMGTGGDNNAWGSNLNTQVITLIEQAIAGVTSIPVTGGTLTLTAAQSRSATIKLSGTLTSNLTLIVPSTAKKWTFINACTLSGFEILIQTSGGTLRNLPGNWNDIVSDGSGALSRQDGYAVGQFFYHGGAAPPNRSIECNGALLLRASYPDLFLSIGTIWGAGNGLTTFALPNAEDAGRFLRSKSAAFGPVGTYLSTQNLSHTHTGSGTTATENALHSHVVSGSGTTSTESAAHSHTTSGIQAVGGNNNNNGGGGGSFAAMSSSTTTFGSSTESAAHTHNYSFSVNSSTESAAHAHGYSFTTSGGSADGNEARPYSMVGLLCIRY